MDKDSAASLLTRILRRGAVLGCLAWALSMAVQSQSQAQSQAPAPSAAPAVQAPAAAAPRTPVTPADILLLADQDQRFVERIRRQLARPDPAAELLASLATIESPVDKKLRAFGTDTLAELPTARLESLARHWQFDARRLHQWQAAAQQKLMPFDEAATQVTRRREVWDATRASAVLDQLPPVMLSRVDAVLAAMSQLDKELAAPLTRQVEISQRANALQTRIDTGSAEVDDAIALIDRRLLEVEAPPLWALGAHGSPDAAASATFARGIELEAQFARDYASSTAINQRALLLLELLLLALVLVLSRGSRQTGAGTNRNELSERVLRRPISTWLLLSMMAVQVLEPDAPLLTQQVALLIALVPLLRLLPAHRLPVLDLWPYIAVGLYVLESLGAVLSISGIAYRYFHFGLTLLALLLTLWLLWRSRRHGPLPARAVRVARAAAWATGALLACALLLNLLGNVSLADTLLGGIIGCGYFGLLLYASVGVTRSLLRALLDQTRLQRLPLLQRHASALFDTLSRALLLGAGFGGLVYALDAFRLLRPTQAWMSVLLGRRFEVGEISISLGDVLVFGLSVFIAWWVARVVRQLLGEQLSARPSLPRGVANSVASLSYYALLLLGFLIALSAAGFKVSQLALVFGALGVGIGFGLQNIVNNFVSGLVLMFERPLRPGDVVDVAGASGRVHSIGLRATTIRTFDGADVVVPNGALLSSSLTNWTLLDHSRRIEIQVGVVYEADPTQVLALLEATARSTPGVASTPAPTALLKGYGDSSLDFVLRAWTADFDSWVGIRSALMTRVIAALREAGIQIPYNQYDLNLKTVTEQAAQLLRPAPSGRQPGAGPDPG